MIKGISLPDDGLSSSLVDEKRVIRPRNATP